MSKTKTVLCIIGIIMAATVNAQQNLYVLLKDGSINNDSAITAVKKITFRESILVFQYQNGDSVLIPLNTIDNILFSTFSVVDQPENENIQVYLNQTTDILTIIQSEKQSATLSLYGLDGKLRLRQTIQDIRSEVNISQLNRGLYLLIVNHTKMKIVKQ